MQGFAGRRRDPRKIETFLALAGSVILGAIFGFHRIADPDLFQHIAVGRAILADPASIGTSSFIESFPGYRYVADKWLASVLAAVIDSLGGASGLMFYQLALNVALGAAWLRAFRRWGGTPSAALLGVALSFLGCAFRTDPRPDTLSQILFAWTVGEFGGRASLTRLRWVFPLTMALWVNVHGYFVNGLLVAALATIAAGLGDQSISFASGTSRRSMAFRRGATLVLLGVGASCMHPQGWRALVWPVRQLLILRDAPVLRQAILEFAPSTELFEPMGGWRWGLLVATVAAAAAGYALTRRGLRIPRFGIAVLLAVPWIVVPPPGLAQWPYRVTLALVVMAALEVPVALAKRLYFGVMLCAVVTAMAVPLLRNQSLIPPAALLLLVPAWSRSLGSEEVHPSDRAWRREAGLRTVAAVALLFAAWARLADRLPPGHYRSPEWTGWGLETRSLPVGAADFVRRHGLRGPLLNSFDNGGYLLYRLHPSMGVFIAGNTSMYPASFLERYVREVVAGKTRLDDLVRRYGFRCAVLAHSALDVAGLTSRLWRAPDWRLVYLDHAAAVFVRTEERAGGSIALPGVDLDTRYTELAASRRRDVPFVPGWLAPRAHLYPGLNLARFFRNVARPDLTLGEVERRWSPSPEAELAALGAAAAESAGRLGAWVGRLEAALRANPGSAELRSWLARALYVRGLERMQAGALGDDAERDLERSAALAPDEAGPYVARARLAALGGDDDRARVLLSQALERAKGSRVREAIAQDPVLRRLMP